MFLFNENDISYNEKAKATGASTTPQTSNQIQTPSNQTSNQTANQTSNQPPPQTPKKTELQQKVVQASNSKKKILNFNNFMMNELNIF